MVVYIGDVVASIRWTPFMATQWILLYVWVDFVFYLTYVQYFWILMSLSSLKQRNEICKTGHYLNITTVYHFFVSNLFTKSCNIVCTE